MKARVLRSLSAQYEIPLNEIIFVGDNDNDEEAFSITGHGIAVYPYHEILEKSAWKTVKSLAEIKKII
jgi:hydroxymethylpyrimidine pyrophosphatase-like HAD family hydrolase